MKEETHRFLRRNEVAAAFFRKNPPRAFFLAGSDRAAIVELEQELIRRLGGVEPSDSSITRLDAKETSPADLDASLRSMTLFSSGQVIVLSSAEALHEKRFAHVIETVKTLDEGTLLIMKTLKSISAKDLLKHEAAKYCASTRAAFYGYAPSTDSEAATWIMEYCRRKNYKITPDASLRMATLCGLETDELASEIEKIAQDHAANITRATVEEMLADHRERAASEWADAVVRCERQAMALAERATDSGKEGILAVSILYSKLMEMEHLRRGEFVPNFRRQEIEKHARRWNSARIGKALEILLELDLFLKSRPPDLAVAMIELSTLKLLETE